MQEIRFAVSGMNCGHCAGSVRKALEALSAGARVEVDLAQAEVRMQADPMPDAVLVAEAVKAAGFTFEGMLNG